MQPNTNPLQPGPAASATDSERIAALERQVAGLATQFSSWTQSALEMAFAAGRACERGDMVPRPAGRPHLRLAAGGGS